MTSSPRVGIIELWLFTLLHGNRGFPLTPTEHGHARLINPLRQITPAHFSMGAIDCYRLVYRSRDFYCRQMKTFDIEKLTKWQSIVLSLITLVVFSS